MEVPEKLALIGGSILLASTLVFTLKSQASSILPNVGHAVSNVFDHIGDAQKSSDFNDNFKSAQQQGWQTGTWGTSKYYIDNNENMHIGAGKLTSKLYDILGYNKVHQVKTINLDGDIQAPQDSSDLFVGKNYYLAPDNDTNYSIVAINGLNKLDTSQVTNMTDMFYRDANLSNNLVVSDWDTSHVTRMEGVFGNTSITNLNIHKWDTSKTNTFGWMFFNDCRLKNVNVSGWNTNASNNMNRTFAGTIELTNLDMQSWNTSNADLSSIFGDYNNGSYGGITSSLNHLTIGSQTKFNNVVVIPHGDWKQGTQTLHDQQFIDGNAHPGTWIKQ